MHEIYSLIGAEIRKRRDALGMTQGTLAQKARLARTSVTNIERGGQALFVHQLVELAGALGISASNLLPDTSAIIKDRGEPKPVSRKIKSLLDRLEHPSTGSRSR